MTTDGPRSVGKRPTTAYLRPVWVGGRVGYRYDVLFEDEVVVSRSLDPEHDLARVLLKRGIRGIVAIFESNTRKPRTLVDVEKAAGWVLSEEDRDGFRLRRWRENPDSSAQTAEGVSRDTETPDRPSERGIAA